MDRDEALAVVDSVLDASPADQTEALLLAGTTALTRYADSAIHQNVASTDATLVVRAVLGKRIGVARTNRLGPDDVREAVDAAVRLARVQRPNEEFVSLPEAGPPPEVPAYARRTERATPEARADAVRDVISVMADRGVRAYGALETSTHTTAVTNSLGVRATTKGTVAHLVVSGIKDEDGSQGYGRSEDLHVDLGQLDPRARAEEAADKATRSVHPKPLDPGTYAVVLEDGAVATLVQLLGVLAFGAQAFQEGRSVLSGKLGTQVTGEDVALWDDGTDPAGLPVGFDAEGVPKRRVLLLEEGMARSVVHDAFTAGREGTASTGHALPPPNPLGPIPLHLFLQAGDASLEEMVAETARGIYVTRFHYTNAADPARVLLTGMTRDGTFLIEDGEIGPAVRNLRFTQGALEALGEASLLGRDRRPHRTSSWLGSGATTVPALRVDRFRFTGVTEF